jgi:hypothetical protein
MLGVFPMKTELKYVYEAIGLLFIDQGLSISDPSFVQLVSEFDWLRVEAILAKMSKEERETFAIGDQEDMLAVAKKFGDDGEYAHEALDFLFEAIGT